jgi:hypothetical protein
VSAALRARELVADDQAINLIAERVLIEYSPSIHTASPSYKTLLQSGGEAWARVGQNIRGIKVKIAKKCIRENGQLQSALEWSQWIWGR